MLLLFLKADAGLADLLKGYVKPYARGGRFVGGYNTAANRQVDPRQSDLFGRLPPQRPVVKLATPEEHLKGYFDDAPREERRSPKRVHVVLDGQNRVRHWTTGSRSHAEDWAHRNLWSEDHPNRAVVKISHADWRKGGADTKAMFEGARAEEAKRQAPAEPEMDWKSAAPKPTHLVMRDWAGGGATLAHRDESGSLHGIRDVRAGPGSDGTVDSWVRDALQQGLKIDDQRRNAD